MLGSGRECGLLVTQVLIRPGLCQIPKATGGGQQQCQQGLLMASTLCQNLSRFAYNAAKASTAEHRPLGEGSHHKTHLSKEESEVRKGEAQEMVSAVQEAVKAGC